MRRCNTVSNVGRLKENLIHNIIGFSKTASDMFGIKLLTYNELYGKKINELRNIETELRVQIGVKRRFNFKRI